MPPIPRQRNQGQYGGGGRHNQASNRYLSTNRGGRPHAGGGGTGKKPPGNGCLVITATGIGTALAAAYGIFEGIRNIVS